MRAIPERARLTATRFRDLVERCTIPSWIESVDRSFGGYRVGAGTERSRHHLVATSRLLWTFAHSLRHGLASASDLGGAAEAGYTALANMLWDQEHGGFFWSADKTGPLDSGRYLYGQAFAIVSLVEHYRATGSRPSLDLAFETFRLVMRHAHDDENGGWHEHFDRFWRPLPPRSRVPIEVAGLKSGNAHLHWMEALAELCVATGSDEVSSALAEAFDVNRRFFYPPPGRTMASWRTDSWRRVWNLRGGTVSFGHLIEFAWMRLRAEHALSRPLGRDDFARTLDYVMRSGRERGREGLCHKGAAWGTITDPRRIWWVQAEYLVALTTAAELGAGQDSWSAPADLCNWLIDHQIDPRDGLWQSATDRTGRVTDPTKHGPWKAGYHEVRAMATFVRAVENVGECPVILVE